ncbi:hypothetical protein GQX74_012670 [Glossina fuscipes]|nr:hypothetical protein GQX74_012670 [Glossina fuscipes]
MMDRSDGGLQTSPLQNASGAKRTQPEARERQQPGDVDTPTAKRRNVVTIHKAAEKHAANPYELLSRRLGGSTRTSLSVCRRQTISESEANLHPLALCCCKSETHEINYK